MDDPFKFDPNSTENEGRWRLIDPEKFVKGKGWFRKNNPNYPGISYVFGKLKQDAGLAGRAGDTVKQTIRFKKDIYSEKRAKLWWEEHKHDYHREWTQEDWRKWVQDREVVGKKPRETKIPRKKAIDLAKTIIKKLGYHCVPQKDITVDYRFEKGVGFPVGSIRRGKSDVGDIDILLTAPISKSEVKEMLGDKITGLVGGEKKIDFDYHYITRKKSPGGKDYLLPPGKHQIRVNLFVTLKRETFGAALIHHTGPWEYNVYIRKKVKGFGEGWKLSQNGLIDGDGDIVPTPTERSLQEEIGVTIRSPSERKG